MPQIRKNLEMRSKVNVKIKVTQNSLHHFAILRGIHKTNFWIPTSYDIGNMPQTPLFKQLGHM